MDDEHNDKNDDDETDDDDECCGAGGVAFVIILNVREGVGVTMVGNALFDDVTITTTDGASSTTLNTFFIALPIAMGVGGICLLASERDTAELSEKDDGDTETVSFIIMNSLLFRST
jgi:hypothetical protein